MNLYPGSALRLFVVDPHPVFIRGIHAFVEENPDFGWAGGSSDPHQGLEAITDRKPEIALVDGPLASEIGFKRIRELRNEGIPTRFIILANGLEADIVFRAIREGIDGFLLKSMQLSELADAVRRVHLGEQAIDPNATNALLKKIRSEADEVPSRRLALLSPQENRVLAQVSEGKTNKEIGQHLNLSEKTVKNYLSKVLEKLGMRRRSEAAAFYARHCSSNGSS